MKKLYLVAVLLLIGYAHCSSQDSTKIPKNSVFVELLGNGGYYSLNYEREVFNKMIGRIGFSVYSEGDVFMPILLGKYFGGGSHHLEIDVGATYINYNSYDERGNAILLTGFLGYRYQKPEGRFLFRIGFTPLYNISDSKGETGAFLPFGGISFGYRF